MNKQAPLLWRVGIGLLVLPWGMMAVGCGSSQGTVSGKVTYQGKVVPGGMVSIVPAVGGIVTGDIKEDGSYTISKVPTGSAKVSVDTESLKPASTAPMQAMGAAEYYKKMPKLEAPGGGKMSLKAPGSAGGDANRYVAIPQQYRDADKSGLTLTVKGGKNKFDIDMK